MMLTILTSSWNAVEKRDSQTQLIVEIFFSIFVSGVLSEWRQTAAINCENQESGFEVLEQILRMKTDVSRPKCVQ